MSDGRFSPAVPLQPVVDNNSGERSEVIPLQARGGSWGAFVFGGVWALCNGVWFGALSFLALIPPFMPHRYPTLNIALSLVGQGVWLYLIVRGRSLAWAHKRWASFEEFDKVQRTWTKIAKVVLVVGLVLSVVGTVVFLMMMYKALSRMNG
ncbi:beta-lactamase regulating signal transducer with metallopeptidase domain [Pseudomonas sp. JUb42]|jgi:beta-lactamase regulating signal transducer with metallopeptidase domain|uniref:hypothetical protein n=1 Tax=Pseudomonas sp. JUb42 TaxID=2940611 RepID=UPI002166CDF4|nr:hypothetical protein [Pseudomonas sp. JUb42]MCS3468529.1 beta-lactamase regulating signal transducer with metallopeptidase domain [Pseudomonas sp. JUb42]